MRCELLMWRMVFTEQKDVVKWRENGIEVVDESAVKVDAARR